MKTLLISLALGASAVLLHAQPEGGGRPPGGPGGPGGPEGGRRPVPPLFAALDANKDGELSAEEIANAATALKALDKDGDGKISREELRPPMGPRPPAEGEGKPRGPRPEGGPRGEGGPPRDGARRGPGGPPAGDR